MAQRKTTRKTKSRGRSSSGKPTRSTKAVRKSPKTKKSGTTKRKTSGGTGKTAARTKKASSTPVTIDRRRGADRRRAEPQSTTDKSSPRLERRKKVNRRRQIDPTTCERDYSADEVEFMNAIDDYKRKSGRMFPTCSEVLEVVRSLGYVKQPLTQLANLPSSCDMPPASDVSTTHVLPASGSVEDIAISSPSG